MNRETTDEIDKLDEILESALEDFDEDEHLSSKKKTKTKSTTTTTTTTETNVIDIKKEDTGKVEVIMKDEIKLTKVKKEEEDEEDEGKKEEDEQREKDEISKLLDSLKTGDFDKTLEDMAKNLHLTGENEDLPDLNQLSEEQISKMMEDLEKDFKEKPEMADMMEKIMGTFMSKDVMYDPMKEMKEKYPDWLEKHKVQLSGDEYRNYERQYQCIKAICQVYETEPDNVQKVVSLMQQMQETGQPPAELLKQLSDEMGASEGNLSNLFNSNDGNCSLM